MRWERMEEQLVEKGDRKKYITERNGRSYWERQGIVAFCAYQWNKWINEFIHIVSWGLLSGKIPHIDSAPDSRMTSTGPVHNEKLKTTDLYLLYTRTNIALHTSRQRCQRNAAKRTRL
jgi:hypothetical protein